MKKIALILLSLVTLQANAQKTTTFRYEDTQARALDMVSNGYVKPLTVEVKVDATKGRQHFSYDMAKDFVESDMKGELDNIRSYGVFMAAKEAKCDVIVAPTFHLFTNDKGGYTLEIVGFAGSFINWRTITNEDIEWIKTTQPRTTNDGRQVDAVLKSTSNR